MLVSLSWLKEYIEIKYPLTQLIQRLSEVGVGVESVNKKEEDTVLELEITPNRPDLLSIGGVAREIAAVQNSKVLFPRIPAIGKAKKKLPITIKVDYSLSPRVSAVIIDDITIKESPLWLAERLSSIGQRSINNVVDITNFVMMELGNPLHAFDYDQIKGHTMTVTAAVGGETFTTVDNLSYKLPKGANIIKDKERIIDLCGIKGGANSGITQKTKRVLLWSAVDYAQNIRQTSQKLGLRSEASHIYERGVNKGGTLDALARAADLVLDLADGYVASEVFDLKKEKFEPWKLTLSLERLNKLVGFEFDEKRVMKILTALTLSPKKVGNSIQVTVPTYRNDLQIEEDLIEEVARLYGYNKLPKTLPKGAFPATPIPYEKDYNEELRIKELMAMLGLSEANTYSLVTREDAQMVLDGETERIVVANPISLEFEVLRPSLLINLLKAIPQNMKHTDSVKFFELGKVYHKKGTSWDEPRHLGTVLYPADYFDAKGVLEAFFENVSTTFYVEPIEKEIPFQAKRAAGIFIGLPSGKAGKERIGTVGEITKGLAQKLGITETVAAFEIDFEKLLAHIPKVKVFKPIPKYPPVIEDLSILSDRTILTATIIDEIKKTSAIVAHVDFLDMFENTRTFRIIYQHPEKNLSNAEVGTIRRQILTQLQKKLGATIKT